MSLHQTRVAALVRKQADLPKAGELAGATHEAGSPARQ